MHLDIGPHLTFPWYLSLEEAHKEVEAVSELVNKSMGEDVEFFIHTDPCIDVSCPVCPIETAHIVELHSKKALYGRQRMC
jgi:divalent metal cation (Fe/Co/Zn/Cd) transporter